MHREETLYALDILLDIFGDSELICDFPNEKWSTVRARETKLIREFCNSGKMIIWLINDIEKVCKIEAVNEITAPTKWLHVPTGKLLGITAGELIQCLSYPELDMDKIFEIDVAKGWYSVSNEGMDRIIYCRKEQQNPHIENVQEVYI